MDISWMTEEQKLLIEDKFAALLASKAKACPSHGFTKNDYTPFEPLEIFGNNFRGMTYLQEWQSRNLKNGSYSTSRSYGHNLDPSPDFVYDSSPYGELNWDQVSMFDLKTWREHPQVVDIVYTRLYHDEEDRNNLRECWLKEPFGYFGQKLAAQISIFKNEALRNKADTERTPQAKRENDRFM